MLGFLSSKRYGLDRVAAKHVALSFRFAVIVALLATDVALQARRVYTVGSHPARVVALVFVGLFFCLCVLLDCSPQMPPSAQIFLSVSAHSDACLRVRLLNPSAGRMVDLLRLSNCFCISACFGWRRCKPRLYPSQNIQVLRGDSAAFHLLQLVHAGDPSAHIAGAGARHEQLRQRVGEALARARKRQRARASPAAGFAPRIQRQRGRNKRYGRMRQPRRGALEASCDDGGGVEL